MAVSTDALDTVALPDAETDDFSPYAVTTRSGPHVTIQAGVLHAGRFWTSTSRSSLKARSVRTHGWAAASIERASETCVVAGPTTALDPLRPFDVTGDIFAPLRASSALMRLGVEQVQQLIGYFESASAVPGSWLPHKRVLLVTRIDRQLSLRDFHVTDASGAWEEPSDLPDPEAAAGPGELPVDLLPASHDGLVTPERRCRLGVETADGPVTIPALWHGDDRFDVSAGALAALGAHLPGRAAATFDDSVNRRPDHKRGAMFRGHTALVDRRGARATLVFTTERVTCWDGFDAETVEVRR